MSEFRTESYNSLPFGLWYPALHTSLDLRLDRSLHRDLGLPKNAQYAKLRNGMPKAETELKMTGQKFPYSLISVEKIPAEFHQSLLFTTALFHQG